MVVRASMKTIALAAALALPACCVAQMGSMSMPSKGGMKMGAMVPPSQVFDKTLSSEERDFVGAAEAMPADKFNFAPPTSIGDFAGVRTFSAEIKHVTEANYAFFRGFGIPGGKSRADIEKLTSRDEILQALKDSYAYAHQAIATITPANAFEDMNGKGATRAGMAAYCPEHANDHYGQLVEYLRMNGIVPPASRK